MNAERGNEIANAELTKGFAVLATLIGNTEYEGVSIATFLNSFAKLVSLKPKLIHDLISLGKFAATKHSIHDMNQTRGQPDHQHHECDDCYSGDTEAEHNEEVLQLSKILGQAYKMSCPEKNYQDDDGSEEDDDCEEC